MTTPATVPFFTSGVFVLPTLYVLQGPDKGRTYETSGEPAVIGRTSDQIQLSDNSASRHHAELRPANGNWVLTDLHSSNGTFLNGKRVLEPTRLEHGDQIKVGSTLLVFSGHGNVESFTGAQMIGSHVDLDLTGTSAESSILSAVDASEESVILQPQETADAVAAWNVVYRVAELVGRVDSAEAFLERVADILCEHLIVEQLVLLMYDGESQTLAPQIVRCPKPERGPRPKVVTSQTIINHVLETKDGVLCANAMTDERFHGNASHDSIHQLGLRSILCVPIVVREEILGVFHLDCPMSHHTYSPEQLRLVVAIGRLVGLTIENMRLAESRVRNERLAAAGETVAYLSHHIRNILQGLQGGAEVIELGLKHSSVERMKSGWSLVRSNLDRIFVLTMNMLTFSKDRKPRIEMAQLNKVVEDVIALVSNRAREEGVALQLQLGNVPAMPLDYEGVHQVVQNIVLNAMEAVAGKDGRIHISTAFDRAAGHATVSVRDNGPGIPEEERARIFDPFHSSKGHGGTGLGLAAASKIVSELGGDIEVQSELDQGTTFHVRLPTTYGGPGDSDETHGPG
ncbi:MAG: ATP-binding protein [Phycisphaerae bacterium]|jgi:signal transduction histidine kinase